MVFKDYIDSLPNVRLDTIKKSAAEGYGYVICSVPQSKDLEYLRELGYSIVAEKFREKEYKISWDVSDN